MYTQAQVCHIYKTLRFIVCLVSLDWLPKSSSEKTQKKLIVLIQYIYVDWHYSILTFDNIDSKRFLLMQKIKIETAKYWSEQNSAESNLEINLLCATVHFAITLVSNTFLFSNKECCQLKNWRTLSFILRTIWTKKYTQYDDGQSTNASSIQIFQHTKKCFHVSIYYTKWFFFSKWDQRCIFIRLHRTY